MQCSQHLHQAHVHLCSALLSCSPVYHVCMQTHVLCLHLYGKVWRSGGDPSSLIGDSTASVPHVTQYCCSSHTWLQMDTVALHYPTRNEMSTHRMGAAASCSPAPTNTHHLHLHMCHLPPLRHILRPLVRAFSSQKGCCCTIGLLLLLLSSCPHLALLALPLEAAMLTALLLPSPLPPASMLLACTAAGSYC